MIRAALLGLALLGASGAARACPNILIGDSLAEGMAPYARADGYEVVARRGAGVSWLRAQAPRCVGTLVIVIGTNDLPGMGAAWAQAYQSRVEEVVGWWMPRRAVWATPGCFGRHPALDRSSALLDEAVRPSAAVSLSRGRLSRCRVGGDGIHPASAVYRRWWREMRP